MLTIVGPIQHQFFENVAKTIHFLAFFAILGCAALLCLPMSFSRSLLADVLKTLRSQLFFNDLPWALFFYIPGPVPKMQIFMISKLPKLIFSFPGALHA